MKNLLLPGLFAIAIAVSACGHKDENKDGSGSDSSSNKSEHFKYQLVENGCDTGEHSADSKGQLCSLLKDDGVNHSCAFNLRKEEYERDGCGTWAQISAISEL